MRILFLAKIFGYDAYANEGAAYQTLYIRYKEEDNFKLQSLPKVQYGYLASGGLACWAGSIPPYSNSACFQQKVKN